MFFVFQLVFLIFIFVLPFFFFFYGKKRSCRENKSVLFLLQLPALVLWLITMNMIYTYILLNAWLLVFHYVDLKKKSFANDWRKVKRTFISFLFFYNYSSFGFFKHFYLAVIYYCNWKFL